MSDQENTEKNEDINSETVESTENPQDDFADSSDSPRVINIGVNIAEPDKFNVGDTIRVHYKIKEGDKTRIQPYEGIVIAKKGTGSSKTFTVRRIGADNIGVERIFPLYSPNIDHIDVVKMGKVRRAKLYYLRKKVGRAATRVKEIKNN